MATVSITDLQQALQRVDYPAGKDDLIGHAEQQGAGADVLRSLRSLPPVRYHDFDEIVRSVDVELGSGPPPQAADPKRSRGKPGVADRLR